MPDVVRDALECLLEPLRRVFGLDADRCNVGDLADQDDPNPARERPPHVAVCLGVALSRISYADDLLLGKPAVYLLHPVHLVVLGTEREVRQQPGNSQPAGITEDQLAEWIVLIAEAAKEWVEVVRRRRQVEKW